MLENGLPRLRMSRSFIQDLPRAVFRFSRAQLQKITVSTFSIQLGQIRLKYDYNPRSDRKTDRKGADGDFVQLGSWRRGKQLWVDLGETATHSVAGKATFHHFRGKSCCERTREVLFQRSANPTALELA